LSPNRATAENRECNVINITILKNQIAGKSHIWECCTPPNRLGGISTIWEKLAKVGNVKAKYHPYGKNWHENQEWVFPDGYGVSLKGANVNHRQRLYIATHMLNSENYSPYVGQTEILVPADPNGNRYNSSTRISVEEINAYPPHVATTGSTKFQGAKEAIVELSSKLLTRLDSTKAVEYCGITPFDALGVKMKLKHHSIKCFKMKEFDNEICFKSQSGKLTYDIPRDMAKDIAAKKYEQLFERAGPSGIIEGPVELSNSVKVNRALLTKGTNCTEWKMSKHRKLNTTCLNAQMRDSKEKTDKQGNSLKNYVF
jgi:hypothetical protein